MNEIVGRKSKPINIPAPIGKKVQGQITEVKLSEKFDGYIDLKIVFPQFKKMSDDGTKEFTKQAFYGIPVDWSTKNKAGRLYYALETKLPEGDVNWTQLLINRDVECIFEDVYDEATGESKGQKIKWIGKVGGIAPTNEVPEIQMDEATKEEIGPSDDLPF